MSVSVRSTVIVGFFWESCTHRVECPRGQRCVSVKMGRERERKNPQIPPVNGTWVINLQQGFALLPDKWVTTALMCTRSVSLPLLPRASSIMASFFFHVFPFFFFFISLPPAAFTLLLLFRTSYGLPHLVLCFSTGKKCIVLSRCACRSIELLWSIFLY